jgi:predicted Na+-dependent transporter
MKNLPALAVFSLMVSLGMSLKLTAVFANWRRISASYWLRALLATFVFPPALALALAHLFRLSLAETVGLFMVGVAPGAPLLTRNMMRKGFSMHLAASYQLWAALMVPIMIPIVVAAAAKLYNRDVWIPPHELMAQIIEKQFFPLLVGMAAAWIAPKLAPRIQPGLNVLGNVLLTVALIAILFKMGPALKEVGWDVPAAALLLAVGTIAATWLIGYTNSAIAETFAICNANRHVGLALLLAGRYLHAQKALPAVACYALVAPLVMFGYLRFFPASKVATDKDVSHAKAA